MTIRDMEDKYEELHTQLLRGELPEEEFRREVQQLQYVDELGRRWRIGWYTGKWYREEQGEWTPGQPSQPQPAPRAMGAPAANSPQQERARRPFSFWLGAVLAFVLVIAAAILVTGWSLGWWAQKAAGEIALASSPQPSPLLPAAASVTPTVTRPLPTATPPPSATPRPSPTRRATPAPTATHTLSPTPPATVTATAVNTAAPGPLPVLDLKGHIYYPVYDPTAHTFHIYVYDVSTGTREVLVRQASQPAISPDGERLAYRSWDRSRRSLNVRELADGHTWQWVNYAEAARPAWSPDSQNIVFPSQHESDRQWRLYRTVGTSVELIRRHGGDLFGRVPTWLAGNQIVYWECALNQCGLYRMKSDGTGPVRLTVAEQDTAPAASPDGQDVAYMSNLGGNNWDVQVTAAYPGAEPAPRRLTTGRGRDGLPAWSPDGRWIAFVSDREGSWAVWVARPDGSAEHKLFDLDGSLEGRIDFVADEEQHGWEMETLAWGP